jgi:hypothetical protein
MSHCSSVEPDLTQLGHNHQVRCLLYENAPSLAEQVQHG